MARPKRNRITYWVEKEGVWITRVSPHGYTSETNVMIVRSIRSAKRWAQKLGPGALITKYKNCKNGAIALKELTFLGW